MAVHWEALPHRGVRSHVRFSEQVFGIQGVRQVFNYLKRDCKRCRVLMGRTVSQEIAGLSKHQLVIAPPFYAVQVDCFSPLEASSAHNIRAKISAYGLVFVCCIT